MYKISYEKRVFKDLDKIPDIDVQRIFTILKELPSNPIHPKSKKLVGKINLYRIKQGDFRIVYTVDHKEKQIRIILISHRKNAYRYL